MESTGIYQDIAKRTEGDIYIGVVGPVRTGKSTFIKNFMDLLVIPNIENSYKKERPSAPSEDNVSSLNSCYYLRDLGLSQLCKGLETFCIVNCQVCQHLSVHINACKLQTVHELAVR